jgi:hypothetical protein
VQGTNKIFFIAKSDVPSYRIKNITYGRIVVAYKPDKLETDRSILTVGGNRIVCLVDSISPAADLPTIKMLWNSVLSTPGAKYFTMDISNFYLNTPLNRPEYMRPPIKIIPQEIIDKYNLNDIVGNGCVYTRIGISMYRLPLAGKLANDLLSKRMSKAPTTRANTHLDCGSMCGGPSPPEGRGRGGVTGRRWTMLW